MYQPQFGRWITWMFQNYFFCTIQSVGNSNICVVITVYTVKIITDEHLLCYLNGIKYSLSSGVHTQLMWCLICFTIHLNIISITHVIPYMFSTPVLTLDQCLASELLNNFFINLVCNLKGITTCAWCKDSCLWSTSWFGNDFCIVGPLWGESTTSHGCFFVVRLVTMLNK